MIPRPACRLLALCLPALCLPALCLPAQPAAASPLAAGGHVVAGSVGFSSAGGAYYADADGERTQEWSLQPGGGVFVADGLALNLLASGTWFRQGDVVSNHYELGPAVEYYFDTLGGDEPRGRAVPYLGAGWLWGRARSEQPGSVTVHDGSSLLLGGGLAWFVAGTAAVDIGLQYRGGTWTQKQPLDGPESRADRWSMRLGLKVFLR